MYDYKKDLREAKESEKRIKQIYEWLYPGSLVVLEEHYNPYFDGTVNNDYTFEAKLERSLLRYLNVAVELGKDNLYNTGISRSTATFYVYEIEGIYFSILTEDLRKFLRENKGTKYREQQNLYNTYFNALIPIDHWVAIDGMRRFDINANGEYWGRNITTEDWVKEQKQKTK
jgi:hypothetical protein